jgi:hypothetical protein
MSRSATKVTSDYPEFVVTREWASMEKAEE